jgi:hypothetical protein
LVVSLAVIQLSNHNTHITDLREMCYSWHPWNVLPNSSFAAGLCIPQT